MKDKELEEGVIKETEHKPSDSSNNTHLNPEYLWSLCCDTIEESIASIDKLIKKNKSKI